MITKDELDKNKKEYELEIQEKIKKDKEERKRFEAYLDKKIQEYYNTDRNYVYNIYSSKWSLFLDDEYYDFLIEVLTPYSKQYKVIVDNSMNSVLMRTVTFNVNDPPGLEIIDNISNKDINKKWWHFWK